MNELQAVPTIRIRSMDVMRGLTLFLMLFVNDLFIPAVPKWLVHTEADEDGMGLADWVFPGFLFMVGVAVPYAVAAREKLGSSTTVIFVHMLIRTLSLLLIGVLILNGSRVDPQLTGMSHLLWLGLLYVFVFLIWNHYPKDSTYPLFFKGMRLVGVVGIIYLVYMFKASDGKGLEVGWWGILGLIGWGYFAAASIFLLSRGRIIVVVCGWLIFFLLNILAHTELKIELSGIGRYLHCLLYTSPSPRD